MATTGERPEGRRRRLLVAISAAGGRDKVLRVLTQPAAGADAWDIVEVADPDRLWEAWQSCHPDLVLIGTDDVLFARLITQRIRAAEGPRHTGIVFVDDRSVDDGQLSVDCLEGGADDFLRSDCPPGELVARIRAVLRLKAMTDELRTANHRLQILSLTDELTGLANMRMFQQRYADLYRRCRQGRQAIAVIMMDLDHFKQVNDTTDHLMGSHVLAAVGRLMRESGIFGPDDTLARYGGDEFVAVVAVRDLAAARARAQRMLEILSAATFDRDGFSVRLTASLGVAFAPAGTGLGAEAIIKAADAMLYRSKRAGRNQVTAQRLGLDVTSEGAVGAALPASALGASLIGRIAAAAGQRSRS